MHGSAVAIQFTVYDVCVCVSPAYSLVSDVWHMAHCFGCSNSFTVMQLTSVEAGICAKSFFFILQAEAEKHKAAFKSALNVTGPNYHSVYVDIIYHVIFR